MAREKHTVDVDGTEVTLDVKSGVIYSGGEPQNLQDSVPGYQRPNNPQRWPTLVLNVGSRCQLACPYCNAAETRDGRWPDMTEEVLNAAWDECRPNTVLVGGSGDPLLYPDVLEAVCKRAAVEAENHRISVSVSTNGLGLTRYWADKAQITRFAVSMNGPREVHDRLRFGPGGGSYDAVERAVELLQSVGKPFVLMAALDPTYGDYRSICEHLLSFGPVQVALFPIIAPPESKFRLTVEALPAYQTLADFYVDSILRSRSPRLGFQDSLLYRIFQDMFRRFRRGYRCFLGTAGYCVDGGARVYGCSSCINTPALSIRHVRDPIPDGWWESLSLCHVDRLPACSRCWLRYQCGGPCRYWAFVDTGTLDSLQPETCDFLRGIGEIAMAMVCRLYRESPRRFEQYQSACRPDSQRCEETWQSTG